MILNTNLNILRSDTLATLLTARLIKQKAPALWQSSFLTTSKNDVLSILKKELMCISTENYGGGPKGHLVTYISQHPVYGYPLAIDLRHDVDTF